MELKGKKQIKEKSKIMSPKKFCDSVLKNKKKHKVKTIQACISLRRHMMQVKEDARKKKKREMMKAKEDAKKKKEMQKKKVRTK